MSTTEFVLREIVASEKCGKPVYFAGVTAAGTPAFTFDLAAAERFASREAATQSPVWADDEFIWQPVETGGSGA